MTGLSSAEAAGVRKAPRHEIAGDGALAVPRGYGDLAAVRDLRGGYFSTGVGLEVMYNFRVLARVLHKWGKYLLHPK